MYDTRTQYILSDCYIRHLNDDVIQPEIPVPLTDKVFRKMTYKLFGSKRKTTYNRKDK